ncbi:MAG: efflux RND transporter periplasmic adaptor subunit [Sphaerochaetaceae bacterium]|nr:efflux RND transporter periplasmic adaptor subunit [Spirochaetales bacterium]MDY5499048.1 efflux RND transporter periplasmic adaptor subunit [Sphaerochaetaceae bacterium]
MKHKTMMIMGAALLSLTMAGCSKLTQKGETAPVETQAVEEAKTVTVQVATATQGHIASYRSFGGDVVPHDTKSIIPTTSGEVKELLIEEGDVVKKDQVVARIDQSKAGMRYQPTEIKSPIDGTVSAVNTQLGAQAAIGQPIGTVISTDNLEIKFDVAERLLYAAQLGGKVDVSFDAFPGQVFRATIVKLGATLDTSTRTREVTIKLDNDDGQVISGMYARVNVLLDEADDAILIPGNAISGDSVFIAKDGIAHKVQVKTGIEADGKVQILDGVNAGDQVVVAGILQLSDGTLINVI